MSAVVVWTRNFRYWYSDGFITERRYNRSTEFMSHIKTGQNRTERNRKSDVKMFITFKRIFMKKIDCFFRRSIAILSNHLLVFCSAFAIFNRQTSDTGILSVFRRNWTYCVDRTLNSDVIFFFYWF